MMNKQTLIKELLKFGYSLWEWSWLHLGSRFREFLMVIQFSSTDSLDLKSNSLSNKLFFLKVVRAEIHLISIGSNIPDFLHSLHFGGLYSRLFVLSTLITFIFSNLSIAFRQMEKNCI